MSSEVGSGFVSIFPTMVGFKARVTRGTQEAGAAGAKTFDRGFKGAGDIAGRTVGRDLKSALSSAAGDLGAAELGKLQREVASAASALGKARLKQQDDAGRVRVAETRLQEAIAKSGEGSSQAVAAEERLASVRRAQQTTIDAVTSATNRLRAAQDALSTAQAAVSATTIVTSGGFRRLGTDFRAGFADARAAQSSFTGLTGSLGGLSRALLDVTGFTYLGRLAKAGADRAASAFVSLATMFGGGLAKSLTAAKSWAAGVGATVRGAFAPYVQYAAAAGTILASPFVRLGSRVATWISPVTTQVAGVFRKLGPAVGGALSGVASAVRGIAGPVGSAAAGAFQSVVSAAQRAGSAAGSALASGIQNAATAGVTVAAAGIGIALTKGFSRLNSIDVARAKLTGLGNDAQTVQAIMGDALASVKGTSFGLGEAATVAASAVAAGIKPGEALQGHLKSIANNASAAGLSMQEMGSIFNKAATQANGVQNDVISQLADKGIPIYQALADQMGVTAGEVFKMASEGKVDFETFSKAATKAAGTVADEMGRTVPGAAKNFLASMGRIGANALEPIYGKIAPLILAATSALGPIEERAKALGAVLLKVLGPAFDSVTGFLNRIGEGASVFSGALSGLQGIVGPLAGGLAALGAGGLGALLTRIPLLTSLLPGLTGALGVLGGPLGVVAAAFAGFALSGADAGALVSSITGIVQSVVSALPGLVSQVVAFVPQLVEGILGQAPALFTAAVQLVQSLVLGIVSAVPVLVSGAVQLVQGLITAITSNLPMIVAGALQIVAALASGLVAAIPTIITAIVGLVTGLVTALVGMLPTLITAAVQLFLGLVQGLVQVIPVLLTTIIGALPQILASLLGMLPTLLTTAITLFLQLVLGLVQVIPQLLTTLIGLLPEILTTIIGMIPSLLSTVINLFLQLVLGLLTVIPQLLVAIVGMLPQIITTLISLIPTLLNAGIELFKALVTAIPKIIPQLKDTLRSMGPEMVSAILALGPSLLNAGQAIIQSFIDGIGSMIGEVGNAIGGVMDFVAGFFPHSPAKRGPLSGAGWYALRSGGQTIPQQLAVGITDGHADVERASAAMTAAAQAGAARVAAMVGSVSTSITASTGTATSDATRPTGAGTGAGGDTYHLYGITTEQTAAELADRIETKKRRKVTRTGALLTAEVS